jgi:hypothetical protein
VNDEKIIKLLESTEAKIMLITAVLGFDDVDLCNDAINYINDAMVELKAPYHGDDGEHRVQSNLCDSVFDEKHIKRQSVIPSATQTILLLA